MNAIVTWTTPYQDAERAFRELGEELETGTRLRAMELLHEHLAHTRDLIGFLQREAAAPAKPIDEWTYDERVNALRHRYPFPSGATEVRGDRAVTPSAGKALDPS